MAERRRALELELVSLSYRLAYQMCDDEMVEETFKLINRMTLACLLQRPSTAEIHEKNVRKLDLLLANVQIETARSYLASSLPADG